jgi:flagellar FliL protein
MATNGKTAESEAGDDEALPPAKLSLTRLLLVGSVGLLLLGGLAGGAYYVWPSKKEEKVATAAPKPPTFFDMPEVLVNLSNTGTDRTQYLKIKVVLELPDANLVQQIQPVLPRVMDTFQVFLREMRPTDLEGSAGIFRVREELTRRVNVAIAPSRINAVLFKEIVVQ